MGGGTTIYSRSSGFTFLSFIVLILLLVGLCFRSSRPQKESSVELLQTSNQHALNQLRTVPLNDTSTQTQATAPVQAIAAPVQAITPVLAHVTAPDTNGSSLPTNFRWELYLEANPGFAAGLQTEESAKEHYLKYGFNEKRKIFPPSITQPFLDRRQPLPITVVETEPIRLNILMCGVGYDFTGGPLSIFHFAVLAAKSGISVRYIQVENNGISEQEMMTHMKKYEGLERFSELISYVRDGPKQASIPTNPNDIFMGTIFFTALMASATQKLLRNPEIIYFIQDYEPIFFPHNSQYIEALESYDVPHYAIFSTPFLKKYFVENKFGVYKTSLQSGNANSFASKPAIKAFGTVDLSNRPPSKKRKLVMYARPHADRNAFDLSISALSEAVRLKILNVNEWEFLGLGAMTSTKWICHLGGIPEACINLIRNIPEPQYKELLSGADIGISVMISPHPSLPPFDFARAGIVTVTNAFATKTQAEFDNVSKNIIAAHPSLNGLVNGIKEAMLRIDDLKSRERNAVLNWPTSWSDDECYGKKLFKKVKRWMRLKV